MRLRFLPLQMVPDASVEAIHSLTGLCNSRKPVCQSEHGTASLFPFNSLPDDPPAKVPIPVHRGCSGTGGRLEHAWTPRHCSAISRDVGELWRHMPGCIENGGSAADRDPFMPTGAKVHTKSDRGPEAPSENPGRNRSVRGCAVPLVSPDHRRHRSPGAGDIGCIPEGGLISTVATTQHSAIPLQARLRPWQE